MDELRLERALRAGPPFATAYIARPLALDRQVTLPPPVSARRMVTIVAAAALLLAVLVAALVIGSRLLPPASRWDLSVQVPRGSFNHDWYRVLDDGAVIPLGDELPALATAPTWSPDGRTLAFTKSFHLWLANGDGSSQREVPQPLEPVLSGVRSYPGEPVWSPDGTMLAVQWESCRIVGDVCESVEGVDIFFADGRFRSYIDITGMLAGGIVWSPESDRVGYTACVVEAEPDPCPFGTDADGDQIHQFVIRVIGSATPLAQFPIEGVIVGWNAADRLLVSDVAGAYTIDTAGGDATWVLGPFDEEAMDPPLWSSDGAMLAWAFRSEPILRIRDARTGIDREVISFVDQVGDWAWIRVAPVAWSPDGSQLVFREDHRAVAGADAEPPEPQATHYVVQADGLDLRRLDSVEAVGWRPAED